MAVGGSCSLISESAKVPYEMAFLKYSIFEFASRADKAPINALPAIIGLIFAKYQEKITASTTTTDTTCRAFPFNSILRFKYPGIERAVRKCAYARRVKKRMELPKLSKTN